MLLSATATFLLSKYSPLSGQDRKILRIKFCEDRGGSFPFSWKSYKDDPCTAKKIEEGLISTKLKNFVEAMSKTFVDSLKDYLDPSRGLSDDDYNTLKCLDLGRFTNFVREELVAESRRTRIRSKYSRDITKAKEKVQELVCKVLLVASDGQIMTGMSCSGTVRVQWKYVPLLMSVLGIALIITAMVQQKSLSLYHLRVIYDTVNFTT